MAASLLGGAAIGAVFGELLKAVIDMKDRAVMFKPTLAYLTTTLIAIEPVIKEMEQQNNELGRAKSELELLMKEMEEGTKLVYKCCRIHYLNYPARIRHQEQLGALVESLVRFFIIDMQAQTARDLKETLLKVRRIHSAVNKMQLMNTNDENVTEITDSVPEIAVESETIGNDSGEQVMEDGTRVSHTASQTKEKANDCEEEKHLTTVKSHDQSYIDRKRFMGICLPIPPILHKISGGFNLLGPPSVHSIPRNRIIIYEGYPYKLDLEDLLRASVEVLEETSYATTYKVLLKNGTTLVMKKLKDVMVEKQEFKHKIETVQRISQHPNVLPPLACYCSNDENLLIYDYMTQGSFSKLLHGTTQDRKALLDWNSRIMNILLGVAKGLAHIHSLEGGTYVHGNIRSSNVLVTNDHQGRISDLSMTYSLSKSFNQFRKTGYQQNDELLRPKKKVTQECDVYSFGVLLFEMLIGRLPSDHSDLPIDFSVRSMEEGMSESAFNINNKRYSSKMRLLAEKCRSEVPDKRPSMAEVVREMEQISASYHSQYQ
ncbi:hypothetical protein PIB30_031082 [Stylosanthes scabra]|uniref:Protein kinase domain-containing protein n=1 Tax=Stylosanthes scabra TaxID=79078 RepID=A0ABU6TBH1_9FABA|nr:hypothetical protein [Stylosanthes scabra]